MPTVPWVEWEPPVRTAPAGRLEPFGQQSEIGREGPFMVSF